MRMHAVGLRIDIVCSLLNIKTNKQHWSSINSRGGNLGGLGGGPPKFEVGTAHASVPQYFEK